MTSIDFPIKSGKPSWLLTAQWFLLGCWSCRLNVTLLSHSTACRQTSAAHQTREPVNSVNANSV